jgi:hypothetical protein
MKTTSLMFALGLMPLFGIPALGQQPPRFDIEATCRSAPALVPQDHDPVQVCMEDEANAEQRLKAIWSDSAPNQREDCAAETQVGGSPSYVDVLTCLQMYRDNASTTVPRRSKQP